MMLRSPVTTFGPFLILWVVMFSHQHEILMENLDLTTGFYCFVILLLPKYQLCQTLNNQTTKILNLFLIKKTPSWIDSGVGLMQLPCDSDSLVSCCNKF